MKNSIIRTIAIMLFALGTIYGLASTENYNLVLTISISCELLSIACLMKLVFQDQPIAKLFDSTLIFLAFLIVIQAMLRLFFKFRITDLFLS